MDILQRYEAAYRRTQAICNRVQALPQLNVPAIVNMTKAAQKCMSDVLTTKGMVDSLPPLGRQVLQGKIHMRDPAVLLAKGKVLQAVKTTEKDLDRIEPILKEIENELR